MGNSFSKVSNEGKVPPVDDSSGPPHYGVAAASTREVTVAGRYIQTETECYCCSKLSLEYTPPR